MQMKKTAVFPGSFDPITRGHENIVLRALPLFDKIIVAIGVNSEKKGYFAIEQRLDWIKQTFEGIEKIEVMSYSGLTVDFCMKNDAKYILRGLRTSADFEFERQVGQVNKYLQNEIETIFILSNVEFTPISSSVVREIHCNNGDISSFLPFPIANLFNNKQ